VALERSEPTAGSRRGIESSSILMIFSVAGVEDEATGVEDEATGVEDEATGVEDGWAHEESENKEKTIINTKIGLKNLLLLIKLLIIFIFFLLLFNLKACSCSI